VNLPMRTRVNANVAYTLAMQNDSFLPPTINPALMTTAGADLLPGSQRSLNGLVGNFLFNLNATTRPLPPLTLSAKYRVYDHHDMSSEPQFSAFASGNDRAALTLASQQAARLDFTRQNLDLDARWRFGSRVAFTLGTGWETWDRSRIREVTHQDEVYAKAALDVTPNDWLLTRLTYRPSFRRDEGYDKNNYWRVFRPAPGPSPNASDNPLMKKFDEAERDRQQVDLLVQVTPTDTITTSFSAKYRYDDYIASRLGLREEDAWSTGVDVTLTPMERTAFSAGYVHEVDHRRQDNQTRIFANDWDDYSWIGHNTDLTDTFHLGGNVALIPDVLDWKFGGNYTTSLGLMEARNTHTLVQTTTLANQIGAIPKRFPSLTDSLWRLDTTLRYQFAKGWTANLGYIFEEFSKHDWRTNGLAPNYPGITSIWLGNDLRDYTAHIAAVTLGYRFR